MFKKVIERFLDKCFFCESWVIFGGKMGEWSICLSCLTPKN